MDMSYIMSFSDPTSPNYDPTGGFESIVYGNRDPTLPFDLIAYGNFPLPSFFDDDPSTPQSPPLDVDVHERIAELEAENKSLQEQVLELQAKLKSTKRKFAEVNAANEGKKVEIEMLKKSRDDSECLT